MMLTVTTQSKSLGQQHSIRSYSISHESNGDPHRTIIDTRMRIFHSCLVPQTCFPYNSFFFIRSTRTIAYGPAAVETPRLLPYNNNDLALCLPTLSETIVLGSV